jgi:hypothetical protein
MDVAALEIIVAHLQLGDPTIDLNYYYMMTDSSSWEHTP